MVFVLALPALIALVPVLVNTRSASFVAAGLLTVATVLGLASIGIFFIPTVALAWVAVSASRRLGSTQRLHRSSAP